MSDKPTPIELRDKTGKLYGKVTNGTLEVKRGDKVVRFDLTTGKVLDTRDSTR